MTFGGQYPPPPFPKQGQAVPGLWSGFAKPSPRRLWWRPLASAGRRVARPRARDGASRVACAFLVYMLPPLPRCSRRVQTSLKLARPYQPSPHWWTGRPAHRLFRGLLSVHSRRGLHTRTVTFVTVIRGLHTLRHLHACPGCFRLELLAGWDFHPLESAAFPRRTPK